MNDWKWVITLAICFCTVLTIAASASADFVGVTTANKTDSDTEFLCNEGNGEFVLTPLAICNVFAAFDNPDPGPIDYKLHEERQAGEDV